MMSLTSFPILQIQHTEITGIASGMAVHNMGTAHYIFQKPKMSLS
jgi:putative effector of murein hydrolase